MWVVYAVACGNGIGVATSFLLPWAMLPDTIDDSELRSVSTRDDAFGFGRGKSLERTHLFPSRALLLAYQRLRCWRGRLS